MFQERYLSPRILHFCKSEVFFECNHDQVISETLRRGLPYDCVEVMPRKAVMGPSRGAMREKGWNWAVQEYTRRSLTKPRDKLIALSGVAKYFAPEYKAPYLAGIWGGPHLLKGLAWKCDDYLDGWRPRSRISIGAPTWSWASLDTKIKYDSPNGPVIEEARILEAQTTLASEDPTGAVSNGLIVLQGSVCIITIKDKKKDGLKVFLGQENGHKEGIYIDVSLDGTTPRGGEFYLLLLYKDTRTPEWDTEKHQHPTYQYLVLQPSGNHEGDGYYERCGTAQTWTSTKTDKIDKSWMRWMRKNGDKVPCEKYLGPEEGHIIRLI